MFSIQSNRYIPRKLIIHYMHNRTKLICLATVIYAVVINHGLAQTNINWNEVIANQKKVILEMPGKIEHQLSVLETNKSDESVRQLEASVDTLRNIRLGDRKNQTTIWLEILTVIDTNSTGISGHVTWKVTPPPDGENGMQYPTGIAPSALKDPAARSNYEAAIRINNERIRKEAFQWKLRQLDERASESFERFLKSSYTSSETDINELNEILSKSKLSDVRIQNINSIMGLSSEIKPQAK